MRYTRLGLLGLAVVSGAAIWSVLPVQAQEGDVKAKLPENVRAILEKNCFVCHGGPRGTKGKFKIFDADHLQQRLSKEKADSIPKILERLTAKEDEGLMPPPDEDKIKLAQPDREALIAWVKEGAKPFGVTTATAAPTPSELASTVAADPALANDVKEIFRQHCTECHGDTNPKNGVKILDYELLVNKLKKVEPGKLRTSTIFKLMTAKDESVMPPADKPRVDPDKIIRVMEWIAAGAPKWGEDKAPVTGADPFFTRKEVIGVDYVLGKIRDDISRMPPEERVFMRYISFNHLLTKGTTDDELRTHHKALAKAVNHLTFMPDLVRPRPVDGEAALPPPNVQNQGGTRVAAPPGKTALPTIFCIDLRKLGWAQRCFETHGANGAKYADRLNLYDLCLLEYPYATIYYDSPTYTDLHNLYMKYAGMVRPIPYVRGDWFCSVCTQQPLYEDMLQLPLHIFELEARLNVDSFANFNNDLAHRAGMTVSGVSRNNRIVERHPAAHGYYWKSLDFQTSKGFENMFREPLFPEFSGGEMIFSTPNHMQAYFVTNAKGRRVTEAPTSIVVDKFASDKTVRNGLACMRCHDQGVKPFQDTVRPAFALKNQALTAFGIKNVYDKVLAIYPEHEVMTGYIDRDAASFRGAYQQVFDEPPPNVSPLTPVSQKFLDDSINLPEASAELGIRQAGALRNILMKPEFAALGLLPLASGGDIRRDAWEDYFDQLTLGLQLGYPIVPLDSLIRRDYASRHDLPLELKTIDGNGKARKTFKPGDKLRIVVENKSKYDVYIELFGTSAYGEKVLLLPCTTIVKAGKKISFPPEGQKPLNSEDLTGKEDITIYYCDKKFPAGRICRLADHERGQYALSDYVKTTYGEPYDGKSFGYQKWVYDRVVHPFYTDYPQGPYGFAFQPWLMCKKTITISTE